MYYSEEIIEEVRSKNDIVDVISAYVRLQKKGSSYFGLCPFHNEKSPSFSVSRQKQMYYCFGCGAGGNVFTFLMEYENFTFQEALKYLAERVGVELPEDTGYSKEAKDRANAKTTLLEINKSAAQFFYVQLRRPQGKTAMDYLSGRGLSAETMKDFGLGYAGKFGDGLYKYLKDKGYSDEVLKTSGLIGYDEKQGPFDRFWNRVIFPIMDANSKVIGFGGRVMGEGKPKYLNSPETLVFDKSRNLYGLHIARRTKKPYFLLCEGYMDVISLHQAGFTNAVASLGTALTYGHANLIKRYVKEVYLTYDSDEAGTKAALRAFPILREVGITAKVIRMEPYKDPDEFIKNLGAEAFEERIKEARNGFMFGLKILEKDYDLHTPEGKTDFMRETAGRIATTFPEEMERNFYIEAVANSYHVGISELKHLVAKTAMERGGIKPVDRPRSSKDRKPAKEDGILTSQRLLLTWLISDENLFRQIEKYISPDDFTGDLYKTVATLLYKQYEAGKIQPAQIMNHFTDEEEHRQVASLFHTSIKDLNGKQEQEKAIEETILRIKRHSIEDATKKLAPTDMAGLQKLMRAKKDLQELKNLHISVS